ncbi:MAG: PIG-L family deacetylase [Lachnospiraceae bacterium]|nr:PIG-L family deacetylase [Lachnospiraceae bacterium]
MEKLQIMPEDRILILSPHPDDECIGLGGLLSMFAAQIDVWLLTDGRYGGREPYDPALPGIRKNEFVTEMEYLGIKSYKFFEVEDGTLKQNCNLLNDEPISLYSIIFVPHKYEVHPDHKACYKILKNALINQDISNLTVFQYEITTPMHDMTHYLDITDKMGMKIDCIQMHASQRELLDYSQASKALNTFRACMRGKPHSFYEMVCYTPIDKIVNDK